MVAPRVGGRRGARWADSLLLLGLHLCIASRISVGWIFCGHEICYIRLKTCIKCLVRSRIYRITLDASPPAEPEADECIDIVGDSPATRPSSCNTSSTGDSSGSSRNQTSSSSGSGSGSESGEEDDGNSGSSTPKTADHPPVEEQEEELLDITGGVSPAIRPSSSNTSSSGNSYGSSRRQASSSSGSGSESDSDEEDEGNSGSSSPRTADRPSVEVVAKPPETHIAEHEEELIDTSGGVCRLPVHEDPLDASPVSPIVEPQADECIDIIGDSSAAVASFPATPSRRSTSSTGNSSGSSHSQTSSSSGNASRNPEPENHPPIEAIVKPLEPQVAQEDKIKEKESLTELIAKARQAKLRVCQQRKTAREELEETKRTATVSLNNHIDRRYC
uniref:Uncharacterized protein n=1 Tax=Oryza brachyantha TaxID=4533 RepID=J3MDQ0_ORYBR